MPLSAPLRVLISYTPHFFFAKCHCHIFTNSDSLFNTAVAVIFAREVLEGCVIIGQYRTVVQRSEFMDEERKKGALKAIRLAATVATAFAVFVVIAVAIPLAILSNELNDKVVEIIEGISKVVAAICIIQLSVKIPVFLGTYKKVSILPWKKYEPKSQKQLDDLNDKEIYFNVGWNLWRYVA
jgi:high-affinity iron transporter